jgi:hypothetical protein
VAKLTNSAFKYITPSKPFSTPKVPQGHPMSSGAASRSSASGYGKVGERDPEKTKVPTQQGLRK